MLLYTVFWLIVMLAQYGDHKKLIKYQYHHSHRASINQHQAIENIARIGYIKRMKSHR
jgi:hypothetical protein